MYITIKRARFNGMSGPVNLPYGTEVGCMEAPAEHGPVKILIYQGNPICMSTSQNAYDYFARNDDRKGLERGNLTRGIIKLLSKRDKAYQARWDKVWEDPVCQKCRRSEHRDHWLWGHEFYNAEVSDLQHIAELVVEGGS